MTTAIRAYRRRFADRPAERFLTPDVIRLVNEADTLDRRRRDAVALRDALAGNHHDENAIEADRLTAADAVRKGKAAASTGTPKLDALNAQRKNLDIEIAALVTALELTEEDVVEALRAIQSDDVASGRNALAAASKRYTTAITETRVARAEHTDARAVHDWLAAVAGVPTYGNSAWRKTAPPSIELGAMFAHLGIHAADARRSGDQLLDLFATEIKESR